MFLRPRAKIMRHTLQCHQMRLRLSRCQFHRQGPRPGNDCALHHGLVRRQERPFGIAQNKGHDLFDMVAVGFIPKTLGALKE